MNDADQIIHKLLVKRIVEMVFFIEGLLYFLRQTLPLAVRATRNGMHDEKRDAEDHENGEKHGKQTLDYIFEHGFVYLSA